MTKPYPYGETFSPSMEPAQISEMSSQERNKFVYRHKHLQQCWTLWKVQLAGHWHYGFKSREDAEMALGLRTRGGEILRPEEEELAIRHNG